MLKLVREMSSKSILKPPECVKNLTKLDPSLFTKAITLPGIQIKPHVIPFVEPILKKYVLKLQKMKTLFEQLTDVIEANKRLFLFDPNLVIKWDDFSESEKFVLLKYGLKSCDFQHFSCHLQFMNYSINDILKAILPDDNVLSSFTQIGHLVHVNLKDHLVPYRYIIGEVLLAKVVNCKTVVYKSHMIDNTYRNFEMEILCGEPNTVVTVRKSGTVFEFDFSKVYWNSRLDTEHERILNHLKPGDVLYDVFAGVGPFSIPAAKKNCHVLANDLNPDAFRWLIHNCKKNKVHVEVFNKDAASFIRNELKCDLLKQLSQSDSQQFTIHIVMNLPANAVEFLPNFAGLLSDECNCSTTILMHVYCFIKAKENYLQLAQDLVEKHLQLTLKDSDILEIIQVRTVSNYKEMIRVSFKVDFGYLIQKSTNKRPANDLDNHLNKKIC